MRKVSEAVDWFQLSRNEVQWRTFVNIVTNGRCP
jgi:hypothetical protein